MKKETRTVVYDEALHIEAYHFKGVMQPFPNHFHEHYVIGFVEEGQRILSCKNREFVIGQGSILLFNPGDNHACTQSDGRALDYRGFNISKTVMLELAKEVTGKEELPGFSQNVICDEEAASYLRPLHERIMKENDDLGKEETLLFLISLLIQNYGKPFSSCIPECSQEIARACHYMEQHFAERISLEQICRYVGLSKSTLLRAFTKSRGITLGKQMPEVVGADVYDQTGKCHLGIIEFPVPVLKGNLELIRSIREKLYEPEFSELTAVDFSDLAQGCKTYQEFTDQMKVVPETALDYLGIAICGAKKKVNKLTGSMALLR